MHCEAATPPLQTFSDTAISSLSSPDALHEEEEPPADSHKTRILRALPDLSSGPDELPHLMAAHILKAGDVICPNGRLTVRGAATVLVPHLVPGGGGAGLHATGRIIID